MRIICLAPSDSFNYPSVFKQILQESDAAIAVDGFFCHRGEFPTDAAEADAIIVSGSRFHVYDRQPWLAEMKGIVEDALLEEVPVLGVCYGHQVLADMLGGVVKPMPEREMGYTSISVTDEGRGSPLFAGFGSSFTCFESHQDTVAVPPADAAILAENRFGVQALSYAELPAWGVQFHPEYSPDMARSLVAEKDLSAEQEEAILATITDANVKKAQQARMVFSNFLRSCV